MFHGYGISSEIKKETIQFSSETAHIKKRDGILRLSGDVQIKYGKFIIKSDFLMAKTKSINSPKIKFIEASENIYFSNNNDISEESSKSNPKKSIVVESNVKKFVAIASGKGGVGKSTTAVNIAVSLGIEGYRVGLLDADVYGPSQPRMLGVSGRPKAIHGDMVSPIKNHGISLMSMGLLVPDETAMVWRGPMVQSALTQMLNNVVWGDLDVMVIDLPPGTGDIQISLAQQVKLSGAVIVSTPQDIALLDVIKAMTMFEKAGVKVLGMVQNMSFWECPDCGRKDHIFGQDGVSLEASKRKLELLGQIPLNTNIRQGSDSGTPVVISSPGSTEAKCYRDIGKKLIKDLEI